MYHIRWNVCLVRSPAFLRLLLVIAMPTVFSSATNPRRKRKGPAYYPIILLSFLRVIDHARERCSIPRVLGSVFLQALATAPISLACLFMVLFFVMQTRYYTSYHIREATTNRCLRGATSVAVAGGWHAVPFFPTSPSFTHAVVVALVAKVS